MDPPCPTKFTTDPFGLNISAITRYDAATGAGIETRQPRSTESTIPANDGSIEAFASKGGLDLLTNHAARSPPAAARVLLAAREHLTAKHAAALLGSQRASDGRSGDYDRLTQLYRPGIDWTTPDPETYLQVLEVASAWSEATLGVLDEALAALDEPEARHPSAAVLRTLLERAEALGMTDELGAQTTEHIRRPVTKQRDLDVLRAACRWIRRLDVDGQPLTSIAPGSFSTRTRRREPTVSPTSARCGSTSHADSRRLGRTRRLMGAIRLRTYKWRHS